MTINRLDAYIISIQPRQEGYHDQLERSIRANSRHNNHIAPTTILKHQNGIDDPSQGHQAYPQFHHKLQTRIQVHLQS